MKFMNKDNVTTLCDELSKNHSQGSEGGAIEDGSVTTDKLSNGAVTTDKLANQSVTTAKIADDAITYSELAPSAVRTAIIQDSAVTNAKINNGAVSEEKLASAVQTKLNKTYSVVDGTNDGLMSYAMFRKLNGLEPATVYVFNLNSSTNFKGYIDCIKTAGVCSIITRDDCESKVSFNPNTWYDIGTLPDGYKPTHSFYTPITLGEYTGRVWCDTLGNLKIMVSAPSGTSTIPSTLRLAMSATYVHE